MDATAATNMAVVSGAVDLEEGDVIPETFGAQQFDHQEDDI